jgi:hypothetical protein
MRFEVRDLTLETPGISDIVCVHPRDQRGAGESNASIEGCAESGVTLTNEPKPRIVYPFQDLWRAVIRAVVDHNKLQRTDPLREDAGDGFVDETLAV